MGATWEIERKRPGLPKPEKHCSRTDILNRPLPDRRLAQSPTESAVCPEVPSHLGLRAGTDRRG